jgi:glucose-6-phosphate 1-dehydrogenase
VSCPHAAVSSSELISKLSAAHVVVAALSHRVPHGKSWRGRLERGWGDIRERRNCGGYPDGSAADRTRAGRHAAEPRPPRPVLSGNGAAEHIGPQDVRDGAAAVLRATRVRGNDPVGSSRRARYTAGRVGDRILPSYVDEDGVDPGRRTETLAEVVVEVNNWRWAGVPFRLRAGKAIRELDKRVVITFKEPNWVPEGLLGYERPDRIHIGLDPEVLRFDFNINGPADPRTVERVGMGVKLEPGDLPPYGQVLAGVLAGDPTLSVRGDQAVQTWRIVEPVLRAWRDGAVPLEEYQAGSDGPATLPRIG